MLLKYQEQDTMIFEKKPPFPFPMKKYTRCIKQLQQDYLLLIDLIFCSKSPHRHCVYRITMLPNISRSFETKTEGSGDNDGSIISISKDGIVCFWKKNVKNLKLYRTVNVGRNTMCMFMNYASIHLLDYTIRVAHKIRKDNKSKTIVGH